MKRFLITMIVGLICIGVILLADHLANATEGTSLKGQQGAVTFQHTAACSAVVLWMGNDTTSWEVDSVNMSTCFASDSTIWCYRPTLNSAGDYFVKVQYHTSAAPATAVYLADHWFVSDVQLGTSSNRDTLLVLSATDSTALSSVNVTVYPDGGGLKSGYFTTDANGKVIYGIPNGAYDFYLFKQGVDFNAYDNITIAGDQTDTLWGTPFSPSTGTATTTTIYTWLITAGIDTIDASYCKWRLVDDTTSAGDGKPYKVRDRLTSGTPPNQILHDKEWHTATTDTGYIEFELVPNSAIYVNGVLDTSSYYQFEADYNGNLTWRVIAVPDTTNFNPFSQ